jgi:5-methylcytosine-specific restriction endonuclease McrA
LTKRETRKKLQEYIDNIRNNGKCFLCGKTNTLEFHHIYNKKYNLSDLPRKTLSLDKAKKEVAKCILLCTKCHKKVHTYNKPKLHKQKEFPNVKVD